MKRRILGVFRTIDDAKNALGEIKKQNMNQAELTVIVGERFDVRTRETNSIFEMATEHFVETFGTESQMDHFWPGLKEEQLSGIGSVKVGYNSPVLNNDLLSWQQRLSKTELDIIGREISDQKIVTFIEIDDQYLPKLRFIMETNGAEFQEMD